MKRSKYTFSKDPAKATKLRNRLKQAKTYKQQMDKFKYGSQGPAGRVRHIKPEDYQPS